MRHDECQVEAGRKVDRLVVVANRNNKRSFSIAKEYQSIPDYDDIRSSKDDAHCLNMCSYLNLEYVVASQDSFLFFLSFHIDIGYHAKSLNFSCFSKWRYLGQYIDSWKILMFVRYTKSKLLSFLKYYAHL